MQDVIKFPDISLDLARGVLIDIDDTLYVYEPCHHAALKACFDALLKRQLTCDFDIFCTQYTIYRKKVMDRLYPQGACRSRLLAFLALFEELKVPLSHELAVTFDALYWNIFLDTMTVAPQAIRFLEDCRSHDIPVVAVSNMEARIQIKKLHRLGISHLIRHIVTSEEVGAEKPSALMFNTALAKLKLSENDVIMVGNDQVNDVDAATTLGIKAYLVELI